MKSARNDIEDSTSKTDKLKTKLIDDLLKKIVVSEETKRQTSDDEDTFIYAVWFLLPVSESYEGSNHYQLSQVWTTIYFHTMQHNSTSSTQELINVIQSNDTYGEAAKKIKLDSIKLSMTIAKEEFDSVKWVESAGPFVKIGMRTNLTPNHILP